MPLYEYQCANCGKTCEILQKIQEQPETTCPHCQQPQLQRQVSAPRFQLKGSGWYVTDFKNKDKPAAKTETTASTEADSTPKTEENKKANEAPKTETTKSSKEES
jgi:putative FmdB family regulatory protein